MIISPPVAALPRCPVKALLGRPGGALALLTGSSGGFPRRPGAMMALWPDGTRVGRLGAGCIDADIAAHLDRPGPVTRLVYGQGGPVDLPLPCGGQVQIALLHRPDPDWLGAIWDDRIRRRTGEWCLNLKDGGLCRDSAPGPDDFHLRLPPPPAFQIHGEGDEAQALTALVGALELPCLGAEATPDAHSAVVTLFHDHDRELPALIRGLSSDAFYVGALGSSRAQAARLQALRQAGVPSDRLERLRGPIGVTAPARDPRLIAASTLTEILAVHEAVTG
ncbi:XdhC family protein [Paracoccus rhizosphaerae]|uniref:XdhC family protein n=1 Tax=Paracoccus rhizosphaerae TaxID=1133347 RepID=A0ABV6CIU2_9RHOB|nr:XdhC family protein [Paracoccus rhizosphaerae]